MDAVERQKKLEEATVESVVASFKQELLTKVHKDNASSTPFGAVLMKLGYEAVREKVEEYLTKQFRGVAKDRRNFLKLLSDDPGVITLYLLQTVIDRASNRPTVTALGGSVVNKLHLRFIEKYAESVSPKLISYLGYEFRRASSRRKRYLIDKNLREFRDEKSDLIVKYKAGLGADLIQLVLNSSANLIEVTKNRVSFTKEAYEIIWSIDYRDFALSNFSGKPMVCKPREWSGFKGGGYLTYEYPLINLSKHPKRVSDRLEYYDYSKVVPVINKLQNTGWRVNKRMFDLVSKVYEQDLQIGGVPSSRQVHYKDLVPFPERELSKEEWAKWNRERQQAIIQVDKLTGKRISLMFALATAKEYLDESVFYYPMHFDYRGRVYPKESHFNLMKDKVIKSLLEFYNGHKLDTVGEYWLKVHIANTYGLDKELYSSRIQWVENNSELLLRVASDPLENRTIWQDADSPFEFVAACYAYADWKEGKEVHLPIQLDATCSGIQMYSGLLRDELGALSTNVIGDTRNDIYMRVLEEVKRLLTVGEYPKVVAYKTADGKEHEVSTETVAKQAVNNLTRSIVKRPTMTVPYSVTLRGISEQISDELKALEDKGKRWWDGDTWVLNKLLTEVIHTAIYNVIDGARKGQTYLKSLSTTLNSVAEWRTPIYNFPVVQTAIEYDKVRVQTLFGRVSVRLSHGKLNKRKQSNQIAPNFIHSIDASVLYGVVKRATYDIGTVHDCFLVHPNNGGAVRQAYRESFVEVMEADPLRYVQKQLDPDQEVEFPTYGTLNLQDVLKAHYIIS